ncbi:MAG TPA: hypothetical protein ENG41_00485 [Methanomicrobia archaeon]|nr:MAG: hypothetical protein DRN50_04135 [Thermococci archaeon]RLF95393.1 MAG: hypothetical protein DRN45_01295 [Thermococci archaeon]HDN81187.1 hypothetical protein [Methanomicrobia archaeon]
MRKNLKEKLDNADKKVQKYGKC